MARNVQPILALAVLPAMATWHSPRSRRPQALSRWTHKDKEFFPLVL
jgi:hypothetical protein